MVLELYTPRSEDARLISDLITDAYSDDIVSKRMCTEFPATEENKRGSAKAMQDSWNKNPNEHRLMVKDTETGDLISYANWLFVPERTGEEYKAFQDMYCPPDWDKEYFSYAMRITFEQKLKYMDRQPYVYLSTLVTPPQHRKRGAGNMLTKFILEFATKLNLPIYLHASPKGVPLYRKYGFKELGSFELDISKVSNERRINLCMLLPAPHPDQPPRLPPQVPVEEILIKPITTMEEHTAWQVVADRAFAPREIFALAFGPLDAFPPPERAKKELKTIEESPPSSFRHYQAVDPVTGAMLGIGKWYYVLDTSIEHHPFGRGWSPGTNIELAEKHFGAGDRERLKVMGNKQHVYMATLTINPEAQRRGVGSKLLRQGLKEVDERGLEAWIESTPEGLGLYKRFGWEEVGSVTTDLRPYGGKDTETTYWLVRKPGAEEKVKE